MKLRQLLPIALLAVSISPLSASAEPVPIEDEGQPGNKTTTIQITVDEAGKAVVKHGDAIVKAKEIKDEDKHGNVIVLVDGKDVDIEVEKAEEGKAMKPLDVKTKKVAFLGVSMTSVDPVLREYLEIPEGQGVMIRLVAGDSPAAKAGLKAKDIVLSVDGKNVGNEIELRSLIQSLKPEQEVAIKAVRKGETIELKATLEEHVVPVQPDVKWFDKNNNKAFKVVPGGENRIFQVIPIDPEHQKDLPENVKEMLKKHFQNINPKNLELDDLELNLNDHFKQFDNEGMPREIREQIQQMEQLQQKLLRQLREQKFNNKLRLEFDPNAKFQSNVSQSISQSDGTHSLTLKIENDDKHLTVKDNKGKVIFEGPVNTDEQRQAVPNELVPKLQRLEKMSRHNFKIIPQAPKKQEQNDSEKKRVTL